MLSDLTLITTACDAENYIDSYIKNISILLYNNCKIIFVDDYSTDNTLKYINNLKHHNFKLIHNEVNLGLGKSRNDAIKIVDTRYFTIMDVDDWIHPQKFIKAFESLTNYHTIDCIRVGHIKTTYKTRTVSKLPCNKFYTTLTTDELVGSRDITTMVDYPYGWGGIYKTESLLDKNIFFDELQTCEDRIFIWKLVLSNLRIMAIPDLYYFYSRDINPNALTQRGDIKQLDFTDAFSNVINYVRTYNNEDYTNKLMRQVIAIIEYHISKKERFSGELQKRLYTNCSSLVKKMSSKEKDILLSEVNNKRKDLIKQLESYN